MNFDPDETQRMKDAGFFNVNATVGTYFICINLEGDQELLKEVDFRKALALAINRDELIEILQNEAIPAFGFVPPGVPDADGGDFKENSGQYFGSGDYEKDCQEARDLIQGLGYKVPEA
jgi:oligopeptide transport system substrate-binding protein